ncbi:hypothetical protein TNCV_4615971 [Trichonephila clavipes]|nr:hypothetical protein TNCV_4615971 [Trichonephila clavipes]
MRTVDIRPRTTTTRNPFEKFMSAPTAQGRRCGKPVTHKSTEMRRNPTMNNHTSSFTVYLSLTMDRTGAVLWALWSS